MNDEFSSTPGRLSESIAANVHTLRKLTGLTQAALAARVGLEPTAVAKIESGKRQVSLVEAFSLASALGVRVDQLLDYPEVAHDRRLESLLLSPLRELDSQLAAWVGFIDGTGSSDLPALTHRIAEGSLAYLDESPMPRTPSTSKVSAEQAVAKAAKFLKRVEQFQSSIRSAIDDLTAPEPDEHRQGSSGLRTALRARARAVRNRG